MEAGVGGREWVLVGRVSRPHGIRGELKVQPYTAAPEGLCRFRQLTLAVEAGADSAEYTVLQARVSGSAVILRLEGINDRTQAEMLAGMELRVESSCLPPPDEGEFYLHSLEGKRALTVDGLELGVVIGLLAGGAQEILVIKGGEGEYLIPAVGRFIARIGAAEVVFDLPPDLLEINR